MPAGAPPAASEEDVVEKAALAAVELPPDLTQQLAAAPTYVEEMRAEVKNLRRIDAELKVLEDRKTAAKASWLQLQKFAAAAGTPVASLPFYDPIDHIPMFAYRRADPVTVVNARDLREALAEYHEMVMKGPEDERATYVTDIMGQVLKPEAIDLAEFRKLVAKGVIKNEVAAACTTITDKAAYVAFSKKLED